MKYYVSDLNDSLVMVYIAYLYTSHLDLSDAEQYKYRRFITSQSFKSVIILFKNLKMGN